MSPHFEDKMTDMRHISQATTLSTPRAATHLNGTKRRGTLVQSISPKFRENGWNDK
jgi:hypothetical protein